MGKKTGKEKKDIEFNPEVQMNIASDLVKRNPWMRDLNEKYPNRFIVKSLCLECDPEYEKYDKTFAEIYGDIFPTFSFPAFILNEKEFEDDETSPELIIRIDLNYTKDEILERVEQLVSYGIGKYREGRELKIQRKIPRKWQIYLEIWDLKSGDPPWIEYSNGLKSLSEKE